MKMLFAVIFIVLSVFGLTILCEANNENAAKKEYYDNGGLKMETIVHADGGTENRYYFDNGQLAVETSVKNNNQDVIQKEYTKKGVLSKVYEQKEGKVIRDEFFCKETMKQIFVLWVQGKEELSEKNI